MNRVLVAAVAVSVLALSAACGGEKKGARSPDGNDMTETSSKEDMPPAPSDAPTTDTHTAAGPGAAGGMLKLAAMKVTALKAGAKDKAVELKADGTVSVDGKAVAKVKGDEVDSLEGTSIVTVGVTGALVGNGVKAGLKFEGDDVVGDDGLRLTVGDDGTITGSKDGKSEPLFKADGGGSAKRAALVVALLWMTLPPTIGAPEVGQKKPTKGDKKGGKK